MSYTIDQVEAIAARLRGLPEKPTEQKLTKQDAVKVLRKEIEALQKRGYSLDEISAHMKDGGLAISTATLKSYMQRAKERRKAPKAQPQQTKVEEQSRIAEERAIERPMFSSLGRIQE